MDFVIYISYFLSVYVGIDITIWILKGKFKLQVNDNLAHPLFNNLA